MAAKRIYNEILALVKEIQENNKAIKKSPNHALISRDRLIEKTVGSENRIDFFIALGEMVEAGLISTGRTINDTYVRIVEK